MPSWLSICIILSLTAASSAIICWKCGSYSDGVGSITPCNNRTATRLETCPHNAKYCITQDLFFDYKSKIDDLCRAVGEDPPQNKCVYDLQIFVQGVLKYVSELTIVRDCVPTCSEKEWWGARTFCCETDECNSGPREVATISVVLTAIATAVASR